MTTPALTRTERGWGGHFICSNRCRFRRNTLLELRAMRIVVSTVGLMESSLAGEEFSTIGIDRYFETMAFHAKHDGRYWDADVKRPVGFNAPRVINKIDADDRANDMHEAVVTEIMGRMLNKEF